MTKGKETNNDLQNTTQKTKDWATGTPGVNSGGPEKFVVPASLVIPVMLLLNNTKHLHRRLKIEQHETRGWTQVVQKSL